MSNTKSSEYFNLHFNGVGYVHDIKRIKNSNGDFGVAKVSVAQGHKDKVQYLNMDCIVATDKATDVLREIKKDHPELTKVFCRFEMSGLDLSTFDYSETSQRAGETVVNVKSRLMGVKLPSVDGVKVATPEAKAPASESAGTDTADEIPF